MPAVLESEESGAKATHSAQRECPCLSKEAIERLSTEFEDAKAALKHLAKQARHAAEDIIEDATHNTKRHPFSALGIAFGVGATLGLIVAGTWKFRRS
jgi:ElaB/YqjD/DUF883 family membrane-anchored ribosome-binding protein